MHTLKIPELDALAHLEEVIAAIPLDAPNPKAHAFVHWKAVTKVTIGMIFGDESTPVKDFTEIRWETDSIVWDVNGKATSSQLMETQRKVEKEAMERGFAETKGLLGSLKNKLHHTTASSTHDKVVAMPDSINKTKALEQLDAIIAGMPKDAPNASDHRFVEWRSRTKAILAALFKDDSPVVRDFTGIKWQWSGIPFAGGTPLQQIKQISDVNNRDVMEKGFKTAQGQFDGIRLRLELLPDDQTNTGPANEWDKLSTQELALAMEIYGSYDHYLQFDQIPGGYGSLKPSIIRTCLSLRKKKIIEFAGDNPEGQTLRFVGHEMKEASEKRKELVKVEPMTTLTKKIFIVHGHDAGLKNAIRSYITDLGLTPVILHERPDQGRTIIEKFEQESGCDFAVISATADDLAATAKELQKKDPKAAIATLEARARQNVIFELGYFVGKIGRGRVMLITDAGIELPSDFSGVVFTLRSEWTHKLWKELKAVGFLFTVEQIERATAINP